jgi:hypothetical protein
MNKLNLSILTIFSAFTLQISFISTAIAESPELSTGGFSGGTFSQPIPEAKVGELLPKPLAKLVGQLTTFLSELGVEVPIGDLGLPETEEAKKVFEEENQIDVTSDVFGTQTGSTKVTSKSLYKQYLKDVSNQYAQNTTLSNDGQKKTLEQIQLAEKTVEISNQYAEDSNGQDVTQNIMRNISNQLALQQQLSNMSYAGLQEDKIVRSLMVSMQGENLVALDKITTARDREVLNNLKSSTYHQGLLYIPGQYLTLK